MRGGWEGCCSLCGVCGGWMSCKAAFFFLEVGGGVFVHSLVAALAPVIRRPGGGAGGEGGVYFLLCHVCG